MTPPTAVNIEGKNLLAKLLAKENIWVQHCKVDTASFNLKTRVMTLPIWEAMSDNLYTMLVGHEIIHALYDEHEDGLVIGKRIDPKNPKIAFGYWNVVADARGERLVCKPYPGLRRVFIDGYKELFDRNFFSTAGRDLDKAPLIDRINLHFKVGAHLNLHFTPDEQVFIDKIAMTISQTDVVDVAKELYEYCKEHQQSEPEISEELQEMLKELQKKLQQQSSDCNGGDDDGNDSDENGEPKPGSKKKKSGSKPKPGKDKKPGNDKGDEDNDGSSEGGNEGNEGDGEDSGSDTGDNTGEDAESGDGSNDGKDAGEDTDGGTSATGDSKKEKGKEATPENEEGKIPADGKEKTKPVDPGPPPSPFTQQSLQDKLAQCVDKNAPPIVYVTLPKPNLKNILEDYTSVHAKIRAYDFSDESDADATAAHFTKAEKDFMAFRALNMPKIEYIYQQFEMKKQAERYKRTRQHKTGALDVLRLHEYKTSDELFKTIAIVADGKNHGLLFVVDWSSSMTKSMPGTLEQLIVLCLFCQKANIPFDVYSLTTGGRNAFSKEPLNLAYADNFKMRNYLSSRMTRKEFNDACTNIFALMPNGVFLGGPREDNLIGCTPLDEAIITSIDLMTILRNRTKAQIVNAIFLTDGGANTVSQYINERGVLISMANGTKFLINDKAMHKVYDFEMYRMTPTMLRILHDRQNIHVVGFYIGGSWPGFFSNLDDKRKKELAKQFSEDGFVISTEWGYDELYITSAGDALRVKEPKLKPEKVEVGSDNFQDALRKSYVKQGLALLKQRMMLDRFVKMIA